MTILHLTDLHLDVSFGNREALRSGYFREYLFSVVEYSKQKSVDKVFITGDIVNQYNIASYPTAMEIIEHLCDELQITKKDVFITNGNHDVDYETGNCSEFKTFASQIDNEKELVASGDRYKIFSHNNDLIICLDSIGQNFTTGTPDCIDDISDEIVTLVAQHCSQDVFVLSHHPVLSKDIADSISVEEPEWHVKHQWSSGNVLLNRFANPAVSKNKIFWFAGDVHVPEHSVINSKIVHLTTGSLYLVSDSNDGKTLPQARIFDPSCFSDSTICTFSVANFSGKNHLGSWKIEDITAINQSTGEASSNIVVKAKSSFQDSPETQKLLFEPLDNKLDLEISKTISDKELRIFGSAIDKNGVSTLSWISITSLFQNQQLYIKVVQQFRNKIKKIVDASSQSELKFLLVGIDNWGAIMAARLGAATNIPSCSVATGDSEHTHIIEEVVNSELKAIISSKVEVFFITDVISTGQTLDRIVSELEVPSNLTIHLLSVFFDNNQEHEFEISRFKNRFAACTSTRLPLIDSNKLI